MGKGSNIQITDSAKKTFSKFTSFLKNDQTSAEPSTEIPLQPEQSDKKEAVSDHLKATVWQPNTEVRTVSIISVATELIGNISTKGDLEVAGRIEGNIAVSGKATIFGDVKGNIEAEELIVKKGTVVAQTIAVKKNVTIEAGSDVSGNIRGERVVVNAKVTGNISARQNCELQAASIIQGDIKAKELSMQAGAILVGKAEITRDASGKPQKESTANGAPVNMGSNKA